MSHSLLARRLRLLTLLTVCLGCTLALLVCGGLCINAFSVTQTSMITTACSVTFLLCMFVVNTYYDKLGYRAGLTLAVLLGVGSFVLFAEARTLPGYYLAGMLAGVSHGLGAMLPASILMLRWFSSRRGTAIGICAAGTGISAVVFSPILSALIERFSLRVCFYFEALVSLLAAGLVFLLIRESPEACGLAPYGTREEASSSEKQKLSIHPSRLRWAMLYLGVILIGSIASPGFAHMMILFTSSGFSGAQAAFSFMPGAIAALTGSYAPAYIVFTLFAIFTLAVVQSTYRLERRSAV